MSRNTTQQLDGIIIFLELPTDRPRSPAQDFQTARESFVLPATLTKALATLSRQQSVPLSATLLAAFKTLLYRYTGQNDILIGWPVANQALPSQPAILPLRTALSGESAFCELLSRVQQVILAAQSHQGLPFEKLQAILQSRRTVHSTPLFQAMFAWHDGPSEVLDWEPVAGEAVPFDVWLSLAHNGPELTGTLRYNARLFDPATVARMAGHYRSLLAGIVAHPDHPLSRLPLLTGPEQRQLAQWNHTRTDYPRDQCIHQLFEAQAVRTPDASALVFEDRCLTYEALNRRANQLAHHLNALGVGPEALVGICVERSLEMLMATLGILKAGGAYVPLDPVYPEERLAFMLRDTQTPVLLTQQHLVERLPANPARLLRLDADWAAIAQASQDNPPCATTPDNLAYVMYTSGSTGTPKGVSVIHRNVVRLVKETNFADLSAHQILLQFAPISFDASTLEIWGSLLNGGRLVIFPPHTPSLAELGQALLRHQVTTLWLTAGLFHLMVDERLADLAQLRQLLAGGDVLSVSHVQRVLRELPHCRLINGYGPTENTTFTCCHPMTPDSRIAASVPIGRPIANTQVHLLDAHWQPVPVGVPGELYTGGDGLARDYLNQPALTAERFVPHPLSDESGARLYRTGDLARWLPEGAIEFLGRYDHQVKMRGFRIELGEIEAVLGAHPAVREVVVLARQDEPGDKRLVAYLVAREGHELAASQLRSFLQEKLPDYMVPSAFVRLAALPLNPNGKVDRQALPLPDTARPELAAAFAPPRTLVEEQLAQMWGQVLRLEQVGIHDNFFDLGGHSLALTQVMSRIRQSFQVEMPLRSIFETPTIAGLAESIAQARWLGQAQELPPLRPAARDGLLPLTFAQEQVWFLQKLVPDNVAYNAQMAIRLSGPLDIPLLERALTEVVRRHEILRTTFEDVSGQPVQVIHPPWQVTLPIVDLRALPEDLRQIEAERLATQASQRPFDTARLPLIRWTLHKLTAQDHILLQVEHHFVHDGWSFAVLLREVKTLYEAFAAGQPSPLPELPVQYADFAVWQRQWMQGPTLQAQLDYWTQKLAGSPPAIELPTDHPRPRVQSLRGSAHRLRLPAQLYEALKTLSLREGVTLFMTLLAALKALLYRYTGQEDLPIGSAVAARRLREIEGMIGMVVNEVVLRTELLGDPTFRELLRQVRQVTLDAYAHQDLPFEKLVEALQPARDLSRNPLFQVIFSFHDSPVPELEFCGLSGNVEYRQNNSAKFDLNVLVIPRAEQLIGRKTETKAEQPLMIWEYATDLFEAATIERMAQHYQALLVSIVTDPNQRLSALDILTETERHQLLVDWNNTHADYPQDRCIPQLFEAQAAHAPDSLAVTFDSQHLTYGTLNRRANQLAHHLRDLGIGPETLVATCFERSVEMVVGLLGILKAGGAYVPLDPAYPQERLAFMLTDTQAPALLTQQRLVEQLPAHPARTICLDADWPTIAQQGQRNPTSGVTPDHLAYVIYTSGSTGLPKGVAITHATLCPLLHWGFQHLPLTPHDRCLQYLAYIFDWSVWEMFLPLTSGASLCLVPAEVVLDPQATLDLMTEQHITVLHGTPTQFHYLTALGQPLTSLRYASIGAEKLTFELTERTHGLLSSDCRLFNMYGPTEATIMAAVLELDRDRLELLRRLSSVPIGPPIANNRCYVLNAHLNPQPPGVPGELYIAGGGLARSYLGRPALTAERFVPDPFHPQDRAYRTGDLVKWLPDGSLEFLGRIDYQVKIRGYRIELGEVETVLGEHPTVREAVVMAREDEPGEKHLAAYVVLQDGTAPDAGELRSFLKARLPDYMLPAAFVTLDALPLTPNGKVDRRALPVPDRSSTETGKTFVAPRSLAEEIVAKIWTQVLGLEKVGVHDNFFALGGHSLMATRILAHLRDMLEIEISHRDFLEAPTVADLAAIIEDLLIAEEAMSIEAQD